MQLWCCLIKIALVIWPSSYEITRRVCLIANIASMHYAGPSSSTLYQIIYLNWSDKQQLEALLAEWIKISLKCLDVSLCFAHCEFDCGVTLTHANYWIISVDNSTNPSQSQFNHFEDAEPLFRHMVPHSPLLKMRNIKSKIIVLIQRGKLFFHSKNCAT